MKNQLNLFANNLINAPPRPAPQLVHEAICAGRTYAGDLFALGQERGLNYNAIAGVRDKLIHPVIRLKSAVGLTVPLAGLGVGVVVGLVIVQRRTQGNRRFRRG